jgi:hypothetical protein
MEYRGLLLKNLSRRVLLLRVVKGGIESLLVTGDRDKSRK